MQEKIEKFDPFMFILGILSVIVAIISLRNPLPTFGMVVIIAAITSMLIGFHKLFVVRKYVENSGWITFNAIIDILIGFFMLFNQAFGILFVAISFAFMFLMDSFSSLWLTNVIKTYSKKFFWVDVILSILGIIIGIMLLFSPMFSVLSISFLIALLFMTFGIGLIVHSI